MKKVAGKRVLLLICLILVAVTLLAYWQVLRAEFINYDDDQYVSENRFLYYGLSLDGVRWAFTATMASTWQPLVWLSFLADWQLFGMNPFGFHLSNLLLHLANTLLLFLILWRMTGYTWRSGFVAMLFAIHPLHVESVAWVTARKDVLSTLFWMLSLWAYVAYVQRGKPVWYALTAVFFALGLMAKPMLVTLPLTLLLLDYWPLGRFKLGFWRLVAEKIPLLILSAASSLVTFIVQSSFGAVTPLSQISLGVRAANAAFAYATYIWKMFWPKGLAIFYPHPGDTLPEWKVLLAAVLLIILTTAAIMTRHRRPYFMMGWLWYLGTLIPTIGLVQFGAHGMADRFTYVPLIGLFITLAWGVSDLLPRFSRQLAVTAVLITVCLGSLTWIQAGYWRDSITLYQHTLAVTKRNHVAHNNLGAAFMDKGDYEQAIVHYLKALEIDVNNPELIANIGMAMARQGKLTEAVHYYHEALEMNPDMGGTRFNLGLALAKQGDIEGAMREYREAIRLEPELPGPHYYLGALLAPQERLDEAIECFMEAVRLKPDMAVAHKDLAIAYFFKERYADAWRHVRLARKYGIEPNALFLRDLSEKMPEPRD